MIADRDGMVELGREECFDRLGTGGVGRLAVTSGALPTIVPVTYAMFHGDVTFRAATGSKMAEALSDTVVAFEVDNLDRASCTGWSVVVVGHSRTMGDPAEIARADLLPFARSAPHGTVESTFRLSADLISGHRFVRSSES